MVTSPLIPAKYYLMRANRIFKATCKTREVGEELSRCNGNINIRIERKIGSLKSAEAKSCGTYNKYFSVANIKFLANAPFESEEIFLSS